MKQAPENWTVVIVTLPGNERLLQRQLLTLDPLYPRIDEVIVVGGDPPNAQIRALVRHVEFDEEQKTGWVTRKKNIGISLASNQFVVVTHDYIGFTRDWVAGYDIFGYDWNICLNRVQDYFGRRFYDWVSWDNPRIERYKPVAYGNSDSAKFNFVPGAYWVAKRDFMMKNPLNESLSWGESEDIEWSLRVRSQGLVFNPISSVRHLKLHRGFRLTRSIFGRVLDFWSISEGRNWRD